VDAQDFPSAFWEQSNVGGIRYGVPALRSARLLFYNVSWAKELGFEKAPHTWDEFREQACAANASWKTDADETNDGYGGWAVDVAPDWQTPYAWLRALNGEVFAEGKFAFKTDENVDVLEHLADLRADGCAWLPTTVSNYEHLAARRALFITGNLGEFNDQRVAFSAAGSTDQWTVIPFPGKQAVVPVYGPDYAVLKSSDARQLAAWLFVRWMLEAENQARWARETGLLPVRTSALGLLSAGRAANPQWFAVADLLPQAVTYPQSKDWGLANKILADGFLAMFQVFPNASPKGVLGEMDTTVGELTK
jgi:ABC-type glycerol-3-phosphate transport system substrate-binding protein